VWCPCPVLDGCAAGVLTLKQLGWLAVCKRPSAEVWGGSSLFLQEMPKHAPVGSYFNPVFVKYFTKASSCTFYWLEGAEVSPSDE